MRLKERRSKMRNIKKKIKVNSVAVVMYDRVKKEERTETITVSEVEKLPPLPENCVLIEQNIVEGSEKELVYSMTPEEFVKHAKIVEK
jgi:hypothetical protein